MRTSLHTMQHATALAQALLLPDTSTGQKGLPLAEELVEQGWRQALHVQCTAHASTTHVVSCCNSTPCRKNV